MKNVEKENKELVQVFYQFLVKNRALFQYLRHTKWTLEELSTSYTYLSKKEMFFKENFAWRLTEQGFEYWDTLNALWYEIYNKWKRGK